MFSPSSPPARNRIRVQANRNPCAPSVKAARTGEPHA